MKEEFKLFRMIFKIIQPFYLFKIVIFIVIGMKKDQNGIILA